MLAIFTIHIMQITYYINWLQVGSYIIFTLGSNVAKTRVRRYGKRT